MRDRIYRAEMGMPPMPDEGAPGPLTKKQRMGKMVIGKPANLTPAERRKIERDMKMASDPVSSESEYEAAGRLAKDMPPMRMPRSPLISYAKGGSASSRADGCCTKGKTKGKMV